MKSATTFFNNGKCCLPDQGNVWHHAKKFTKTGFDPFIKYLTEPIFTDFSCCEGISCLNSDENDSRDRGALFIGHLLNMVGSSGKKLIWKQSEPKYQEMFFGGSEWKLAVSDRNNDYFCTNWPKRVSVFKGKDTLWNFFFRGFHEIQFQEHFMRYKTLSWNALTLASKFRWISYKKTDR